MKNIISLFFQGSPMVSLMNWNIQLQIEWFKIESHQFLTKKGRRVIRP